jgi:transcriptional regulator with XRE-family HTH domain
MDPPHHRALASGPMTTTAASPGTLLRGWRTRRRRSQMDLALEVGVSTRHLSYVETGRSRASRELLLDLADHLDVPLRERNSLLLAAGYAPTYSESRLDAAGLASVRDALEHVLAGHEPFPALVVDRCGDVVLTNRAVDALLLGLLDPAWLEPPVNVYRLSVHPEGLARHIRNADVWTAHLVHRLERLTELAGDPRLAAVLDDVRRHAPGSAPAASTPPAPGDDVVLPLHLDHPVGELRLYSTITHFGAAWDVTLDELSIETFLPADAATRERLSRL